MKQLTYLTEKDLEYFEKLEEKGEAIIIRIDPDVLVHLDLDELDEINQETDPLTGEQLQAWLEKNHAVITMNTETDSLSEYQKEILGKAKSEGFTDKEMNILRQNCRDDENLKGTYELVKELRKEKSQNGTGENR